MVPPNGLRSVKGYVSWVGKVCGRELVKIEIVVGRASGLWVLLSCERTMRDTLFCGFLALA
jgi:hypothetical protein